MRASPLQGQPRADQINVEMRPESATVLFRGGPVVGHLALNQKVAGAIPAPGIAVANIDNNQRSNVCRYKFRSLHLQND